MLQGLRATCLFILLISINLLSMHDPKLDKKLVKKEEKKYKDVLFSSPSSVPYFKQQSITLQNNNANQYSLIFNRQQPCITQYLLEGNPVAQLIQIDDEINFESNNSKACNFSLQIPYRVGSLTINTQGQFIFEKKIDAYSAYLRCKTVDFCEGFSSNHGLIVEADSCKNHAQLTCSDLFIEKKKMNDKNILLQKLHKLNELFLKAPTQSPKDGNPSEKVLEQMESLLIDYLKKYPQDTDMWLKLTMVEFTPPWEDYDRIEKYIRSILEYDENNIQALLVLAYAQYIYRGEITEDLFIRLQNVCNITVDKELLSMIYSAIAWYYSSRNEKECELSLLKSIYYCNKHVDNYRLLGRIYLETSREVEGKKMIQYALANVRKVYESDDDSVYDITDITSFFNEYYKGTHTTQPILESLRKLLD